MTRTIHRSPHSRRCFRALVCALLAVSIAHAEPVFLAEEYAGLVPIESGERVLRLVGIAGDIRFRVGREGEVRFLSKAEDDREIDVPLEVWRDGRTLELRPSSAGEPRRVELEGTVPPGFAVEIETSDSRVELANTKGEAELRGERLELVGRGLGEGVRIEASDSRIDVQGVEGSVGVEGDALEVTLARIDGPVGFVTTGSTLTAQGLGDAVDLDLSGGSAQMLEISGPIRVDANGAAIEIEAARAGGRFELEDTILALAASRGKFEISTDAEVTFENLEGDLHVNNYGAGLTGSGHQGLLEVKTSGSPIRLEAINGPVRIEGDDLRVDLKQMGGELWVLGSGSRVEIDGASGPVYVENEYGDVRVNGGASKLEVFSNNGDVHVTNQNGPVTVRAEGASVVVEWVSLNWTEDSEVVNASGDVAVGLPANGGCTIEVRSSYGRVESEVEGIEVASDGSSARGVLRRQSRPTLRVQAEGNARIAPTGGLDAVE